MYEDDAVEWMVEIRRLERRGWTFDEAVKRTTNDRKDQAR